jgi:NTP pyrophosphatase (non-canonical NTP hydrolase)
VRSIQLKKEIIVALTLSDYQQTARKTLLVENEHLLAYLALGLGGEAGEIQNKLKKVLRGDYSADTIKDDLGAELGDVLWYLAVLAETLGLDLGSIAQANLDKLASRQQRGQIRGSGDER